MPELPEVENVRRSLSAFFPAGPVTSAHVAYESLIWQPKADARAFIEGIRGRVLLAPERRGKYLIFPFESEGALVIHLGMTGKLLKKEPDALPSAHAHVILNFRDRALHYEDVRRFGRLFLFEDDPYRQAPLKNLGPEPLGEDFNQDQLYRALRRRKAPIKALLLNQKLVAGLGNIYVDESLFAAGIRPGKAGGRMTRSQTGRIVQASKEVLSEAIRLGGSSIRDYRNADDHSGSFQEKHYVYGRAGQPCRVCQSPLSKKTIAGRSSVYCPHCQKS